MIGKTLVSGDSLVNSRLGAPLKPQSLVLRSRHASYRERS